MLRVVPDQPASVALSRGAGEFAQGEAAMVPTVLVGHAGDRMVLAAGVLNMRVAERTQTVRAQVEEGDEIHAGRVALEFVDDEGRMMLIDADEHDARVATDDTCSAWVALVELIANLQDQLARLRDYAVIRTYQSSVGAPGMTPSEIIRGDMESAEELIPAWCFSPGGEVQEIGPTIEEGHR